MTTRAFAMHELAARAWWYLSPYRDERGLAARRFRELARIASDDTRLQVIGELALEGYHARAITEAVLRDRARKVDAFAPPDHEARATVRRVISDLAEKMRLGGGRRRRLPTAEEWTV